MAWCPFAVHQPIPETYSQGLITPTTIISHEAVSWADSLYGYWTSGGVELESHFYIGRTGIIYQFMDTIRRADANMYANPFAVSIETWDNGGDVNGTWNAEQMTAQKRLHAWLCQVHPSIPKRGCTSWNGGGIGWHNLFADQWAGGPRACPGPNRAAQVRNEIIPFVAGGGGWDGAQTDGGFLMSLSDAEEREILAFVREFPGWKANRTLDRVLSMSKGVAGQSFDGPQWTEEQRQRDALTAKVDALQAKVDKLSASGVPVTVDYDRISKTVNDEDDRRDRDGDRNTGAPS